MATDSVPIRTRAIVCSEPPVDDHTPGNNWHVQEITVRPNLGDHDLLIEIIASGICHTDLVVSGGFIPMGPPFPRVLGHEGAGYVKAIGAKVTKDVVVGDPVLLSFAHCMKCAYCQSDRPNICEGFMKLNLAEVEKIFTSDAAADGDREPNIAGKFFGQSSFANLSVVSESCVLPAKDLIKNEDELKLFAPLGCGIQTGAGSVLNVAKATKEDRVLIIGLGGVGLSALMAAVLTGCRQVVAVDRVASRIEMAKSLGATHSLNTADLKDLPAAFKDVTDGIGPTVVIDTAGVPKIIEAAYNSLAKHGSLVFVGAISDPNFRLQLDIQKDMMGRSLRLFGCIEGDSLPREFIPQLISYYRAGRFPLDKFTKFYKADDFKSALHDMHSGETIKPVLVW